MRIFRPHIIYSLIVAAGLTFLSSAAIVDVNRLLKSARESFAEKDYRKTEQICDSILGADRLRGYAKFEALGLRASSRKKLGSYIPALNDYDSALEMPVSELNLAVISLNKSDLLLNLGQYDNAEALLNRLSAFTDNGTIELRRIANLATVYARTGRADSAISIYRHLISESRDESQRGRLEQNLGFILMEKGDMESARDCFMQAVARFDADNTSKAIVLSNLAEAESFSGKQEDAVAHIDEALEILGRKLGENHPDYITALRKRGEILLVGGKNREAAETYRRFFRLHKTDTERHFAGLTEQQRLDFWKKEKPLMSQIFGLGSEAPEFLYDVALYRRAIALDGGGSMSERKSERLGLKSSDIAKKLKKNEAAVEFILYPEVDASGSESEHYGALVMTANAGVGKVSFVDLGRKENLENFESGGRKLIQALKTPFYEDKDRIYSDTALYGKILNPILEKTVNATDIYFAPDGLLHLLAIEYLPAPGGKNDIKLHRLTTTGNLLNRKAGRKDDGSMLLVGGLDYSEEGDTAVVSQNPNHEAAEYFREKTGGVVRFEPLPGMLAEVNMLDSILAFSRKKVSETEEEFKAEAGKYRKLHFATHGYALKTDEAKVPRIMRDSILPDRSLLASGIALTGANVGYLSSGREDGILSARELCDMDLSDVELVVLSACQTADGEVSDEGPAGLVRGFKKAGVKTVIATLWEVDDISAMILMREFYTLRNKGVTRSRAFAEARKRLMEYELSEDVYEPYFDPATMTTVFEPTREVEKTYPFAKPCYNSAFILIDETD